MRILAGTLARKELVIPSNLPVRPTSSKLRGQVFNICADRITDANVLDIFAGTGSIGFEALSRGALTCTFVEKNPLVIAQLHKNIDQLHLSSQCNVLPLDVEKGLSKLSSQSTPFSFIYIDPPYDISPDILVHLLEQIDQSLPVQPGSCLFLEMRKKRFSPPILSSFSQISSRVSGDAELFEFEKNIPLVLSPLL